VDGIGDFIIDFPSDVLASLGVGIGDVLMVDGIDGAMVLAPISSDSATPLVEPPGYLILGGQE